MTNLPYTDISENLAKVFSLYPVARTDATLTSVFGDFTIITRRVMDWNQVVESLPAIVIDVDPNGITYEMVDNSYFRLIPIVVVVYIPLMTRGILDAQARDEEDKSDLALKTAYSDIEELVNLGTSTGSSYSLQFVNGFIPYEAFDWDEPIGVRIRVAQLNLLAKSLIR